MNLVDKRYSIIKKIGQGGMGVVYLAEDKFQSNKKIALKTIISKFFENNNEALLMFKNEYQVMTKLKHPNLTKVYDYGKDLDNNIYYITMEYNEGVSLTEIINSKQISEKESTDILVNILRAFEFIHSRNIIYRDVKPENIMISKDSGGKIISESVKLLDFGLADMSGKNRNGSEIKGTINYFAPEIINQGKIDSRTDIFAIGILFYEMLTGKAIYLDSTVGSILSSTSSSLRFNQNLDLDYIANRHLREIIRKMTAYEKEDRYSFCSTIIDSINEKLEVEYEVENRETKLSYVLGVNYVKDEQIANFFNKNIVSNKIKLNLLVSPVGYGKTRVLSEYKKKCQLKQIRYAEFDCYQKSVADFFIFSEIINNLLFSCKDELIQKYGSYLKYLLPDHILLKNIDLFVNGSKEDVNKVLIVQIADFMVEYSLSINKRAKLKKDKLILFIDNLQRADERSLAVMQELMYRLFYNKESKNLNPTIVIFATARKEEVDRISNLIESLKNRDRLRIFNFKQFNVEKIKKYISMIFGKKQLASSMGENLKYLKRKTGGNPLYIKEMFRDLLLKNIIIKENSSWKITKNIENIEISDSLLDIVSGKLLSLNLNCAENKLFNIFVLYNKPIKLDSFLKLFNVREKGKAAELFNKLIDFEVLSFKDELYSLKSNIIYETVDKQLEPDQKYEILNEVVQSLEDKFVIDKNGDDLSNNRLFELSKNLVKLYEVVKNDINKYPFDFIKFIKYLQATVLRADKLFIYKKSMKYIKIIEEVYSSNASLISQNDYFKLLLIKAEGLNILGGVKEEREIYEENYHKIAEPEIKAEFISKLLSIYLEKGEFDKFKSLLVVLLNLAEKTNSNRIKEKVYFNQALNAKKAGKYELALKLLNTRIQYLNSNKGEERKDYIDNYNHLAKVYFVSVDYINAKKYFELFMKLSKEDGNLVNICAATCNLGVVERKMGNHEKGKCYYRLFLKQATKLGIKSNIKTALLNLGIISVVEEDYKKGLELYKRSLILSKELMDESSVAVAYRNIGTIYYNINKYDEALKYLKLSFKLNNELDQIVKMLDIYYLMTLIYLNTGDFINFKKMIKQFEKLTAKIDNKKILSDLNYVYGAYYKQQNNTVKAYKYFKKSYDVVKDQEIVQSLLTIVPEMCYLFIKGGDLESAKKYFEGYSEMADNYNDIEHVFEAENIKALLNEKSHEVVDGLVNLLKKYKEDRFTVQIYFQLYRYSKDLIVKEKAIRLANKMYKKTKLYHYKLMLQEISDF